MRMGKLGVDALALGALAVVSAATTGGGGCSTTKPTELVPGVLSQVVVPHDLQAIRVTVLANGKTAFDQGYDVGPTSTVALPSTLGVVSGAAGGTVVTITVRGYEKSCEQTDDCNQLGNAAVGSGGARILRRSVQSFVDQHTLLVPMPLSYSRWNSNCGDGAMACKGNSCVDTKTKIESLVDFNPSLIDGTDVCFSPRECFGDQPDGGRSLAIAPLLVDADTCTYAFPAPAPVGLNVRAYFQNFGWTTNASGPPAQVLREGGEQEILNEDPVEGFTLVTGTDAGANSSRPLFRLAPGLCKLAKAARNPPPPPAAGALASSGYITISDLRVANLCPPKPPLLPICAGERTNGPGLPSGEMTTDQTCNVGVAMAPTASALYVVMDHSTLMHGAFGAMGSATALSLSLSDPVFKRTSAAFTFLPGPPVECTSTTTSFTMPEIDFGLAGAVQGKIASKLDGWTATDTTSAPSPLDLQAAMRLDAGAYAKIASFLKGKEPPNVAAVMFFVNRTPDVTNDCNPPLGGQASVQQAIEAEILAAYSSTPSMQTYFVVLDDDAHDANSPTGALTFFNKIRADLPQAVQILDASQTGTMQAAQTVAANFSKLVTQLGTCVYDYGLPAGTDASHLEVKYSLGQGDRIVPFAAACTAATQSAVDGWNLDNGRLRMCGNSCSNLRQAILASAAVALQNNEAAQDIPVTATILCAGAAPVNDASAAVDASTDFGEGSAGSSSGAISADGSFNGGSGASAGTGATGGSGATSNTDGSLGASGSSSGSATSGSTVILDAATPSLDATATALQ